MPASLPHRVLSRRDALKGLLAVAGTTALVQSTGASTTASAATMPQFVANYATNGFSRYLLEYPAGVKEGLDYGVVPDPLGTARRVAFFDNWRGLALPGTMPRSAAETPRFIRPLGEGVTNDEYWFAASVLVPEPSTTLDSSDWLSVATPAFGPPFRGTSPLSLSLFPVGRGRVRVLLGGDPTVLGANFTMPTNTWCRVAINFKFAYDGWARMWIGAGLGGSSWQGVALKGRSQLAMPTMARGVNDACVDPAAQANSSRIGSYGYRSRVWVGQHAVVRSAAAMRDAMR